MPQPDPLSAAREVLRLAELATPGPWSYEVWSLGKGDIHSVFQDAKLAPAGYCILHLMMGSDMSDEIKEQASKNGPFIAHCREAAPAIAAALLAKDEECERLRAVMQELVDAIAETVAISEGIDREYYAAVAALAPRETP